MIWIALLICRRICSIQHIGADWHERLSCQDGLTQHIRGVMKLNNNIRNVTMIAHSDHGKTTLTDFLIAAVGIIDQDKAGSVMLTNTRSDEAERGITIKSTGISIYYEMSEEALRSFTVVKDGNKFLINLIDSPGHVDFSSEVTAALRITDGAIVVVDCIDGVCAQTQTVIRQDLAERVKPVLAVNKIDRCFIELQYDGEKAYQSFLHIIEDVNAIIETFQDSSLGDIQVSPEKGTVSFSAGMYGWGFSLATFAKMYAIKFNVDEVKMMERLWGENFFDPVTRKWSTQKTSSPTCKRGFVQFCYVPIKQIINTCMNDQKDSLWIMLQKIGVASKLEDKELFGKALMKRVMQTWLPVSSVLFDMIVGHLPSASAAQKYRVDNLYEGPLDDAYATAIRNCDPDGPLVLYISKMVPASDKRRFFAFGCVFSGTVCTGSRVRIMGPNYIPGQKKDLYTKSVQRTLIWMGKRFESVDEVPCGNTVALIGLDKFISKNATIPNDKEVNAYPIRAMRFSVSPVVRVAVQCKVASDISKLLEGLKRLAKSDPMVVCSIEESGEPVIAGAGELHLDVCLKDLVNDFMRGVEITKGDPTVFFRETVLEMSCRNVMSRSPNRHNRLYMKALPLEEGLVVAIKQGRIGHRLDPEVRSRILSEEFGWDMDQTRRIWCFGPGANDPNLVVNKCKGVPYLQEIKGSFVSGFQWASREGVLAEEHMHGICFDVCDSMLHPDVVHRKPDQIIAMSRKAVHASQLTVKPRLLEPVYRVEIETPINETDAVIGSIFSKRGQLIETVSREDRPVSTVMAYVPIVESFSLLNELRSTLHGQALVQCVFDHWQMIPSDPLQIGSPAAQLVANIRMRKGLNVMPTLADLEE